MAGAAFWLPNYWMGLAPQGAFSIPTPPAPNAGATVTLTPEFAPGPIGIAGLDPYRPWVHAVLSNTLFVANGHDQPRWWDEGSNLFTMGSVEPTTFVAAEVAGATFNLDDTIVYRCVYRSSAIKKETAPQVTEVTITLATADVDITWTPSEADAQFDRARIYRQLQSTGFFVLVADVPVGDGTYTDNETDAQIRLNTPYIRRFRQTLPPRFKGMVEHLNKLWGWTGNDSVVSFSQTARLDGEFVVDDFPSGNVVEVNPNESDNVTASVVFYTDIIFLKKRGAYVLSGDRASNFVLRGLFKDRGCLGPRCIINIEGVYYFLDERGLYLTTLNGEPMTAGAAQGTAESPLAGRQGVIGIWSRMNLDAADRFWLFNNEAEGQLEIHVALDGSPSPLTTIIYDYRGHRFVSIDDGVPAFAGGYLDDALGSEHPIILDELSHAWELDIGNSEGVFAGDTTATITALGPLQSYTTTGTFDPTVQNGLAGSSLERYDATGDVVDQNRVWKYTASDISPLYWSDAIPDIGEAVAVGTIPWVWEMLKTTFGTNDKKWVQSIVFETGPEAAGEIRVDTQADSGGFQIKREIDLTSEDGRSIVNVDDRCWRWQVRTSTRYAGIDVQVIAITPYARARYDRQ